MFNIIIVFTYMLVVHAIYLSQYASWYLNIF